jgi:hypothetical protein
VLDRLVRFVLPAAGPLRGRVTTLCCCGAGRTRAPPFYLRVCSTSAAATAACPTSRACPSGPWRHPRPLVGRDLSTSPRVAKFGWAGSPAARAVRSYSTRLPPSTPSSRAPTKTHTQTAMGVHFLTLVLCFTVSLYPAGRPPHPPPPPPPPLLRQEGRAAPPACAEGGAARQPIPD